MQIKSILVYLDTRHLPLENTLEQTLSALARLSLMHDARLVLCDVLEQPPGTARLSPTYQRLVELREEYAKDRLQRFSASLRHLIDCEVLTLRGDPFLTLTRYAIRHEVDLVVCTGGREAFGRQAATANHLLRKCPAAVWLMGPRGETRRGSIVVAVDRDIFDASELSLGMATRLVEAAVAIARGETATIRLVHAWEVYGAAWLGDPAAGLGQHEITEYIESQRYSHTLWMEALHEYLRGHLVAVGATHIETDACLVEGAAAEVMPDWLLRNGADLLVIGTLGASGTPGMFIGNTAEAIISRALLPVLAIKPPGFRSPVSVGERRA